MDIKLIVANGKHAGQEIKINKDPFEIGKSSKCQLRPGGTGVERHHCVILRKTGYAGVRDLKTPSGTYVNEERITGERELHTGDKLRVGTLILEVQLTVGIGGNKKPKISSVREAATRAAEKQKEVRDKDDDVDIFAIFDEDVPSEEDLPSFVTKKRRSEDGNVSEDKKRDDDALAKEKKMQESTRNAAADTIKAILNQTKFK
ncbi:MAG: FHA domain-containing protein [Planctomycetia bacterium]|nr:FHA domain-containing protein [Planctomycetia bacterium]